MAGSINIEKLYAALPDVIGTEADLDAVLRRIGKVPDWDGAKLSLLRHSVTDGRLVVRNAEGVIVKAAELPKWPTDAELLKARQQREVEEMFPPQFVGKWDAVNRRVIGPDEPAHPRFREQRERDAEVLRVVAPRLEALETQVRGLQEQLAALTAAQELVAA